jgi:murein DD-endopeptidase MepM/ murein hydrolase activator NlpD
MTSRILIFLILLSLLAAPVSRSSAQQDAGQAYYVVQYGDTLWDIALRFRLTVDQLVAANGLADAGQINVGDNLLIPGLLGVQGRLITQKVPYGESLQSLSRLYQTPAKTIAVINQLSSPYQLYAGFDLIIPEERADLGNGRRVSLRRGESPLELAAREGLNQHQMAAFLAPAGIWQALPGEILRLPGEDNSGPGSFPSEVHALEVNTAQFAQGKTAVIKVQGEPGIDLSGSWMERELKFFEGEPGTYTALQGIHAMTRPGVYPLSLQLRTQDGNSYPFSQLAYVRSGSYPQAPDLVVDEATLDPAVTRPEDLRWSALAEPATPERMWEGVFTFPSPRIYLEQYTARFGERRTYNSGPDILFHTGLDVAGGTGTEVYAAAPGIVIFAEELLVRGNAIMVDHGWGVYTAYMHLSEFRVERGEQVEAGQLIGLVGNTGRSSGSHLHWEVIAGGVQVDPLDWLNRAYP